MLYYFIYKLNNKKWYISILQLHTTFCIKNLNHTRNSLVEENKDWWGLQLLIFPGIFSFHSVLHSWCLPLLFDDSAQSAFLSTCRARWYPDRTEYSPFLLCIHVTESSTPLRLNGILQIASASSRLKCAIMMSLFHTWMPQSMRSDTLQPSSIPCTRCRILFEG